MRKKSLIIFFILLNVFVFSQGLSEKVIDKKIYGSPTQWSCIDKHFGYIFINYGMAIPITKSIENSPASGKFNVGYTYRFKIAKPFDLGAELNYALRFSNIKKSEFSNFESDNFYSSQKIKTYHHGIKGTLFARLNLNGATHRQLGLFLDLGGFYDFSFTNNLIYYSKTKYFYQKTKLKKPEYFNKQDYGVFIRFGYNYISVFCEYSFGKWITNFSSENLNFSRPALNIGIQLNLYVK
ncbi:MAG: PorT family protein [Bacteroidales bacterium]|jgi:hypothetical protein|nr:PorT family protein [Bacteroidales bacterium]